MLEFGRFKSEVLSRLCYFRDMNVSRITIEAGKTEKNYWADLWHFRELLYILSWRDVKVRYKQAVLGAAWAVIRPLLQTAIFTIMYSRIANLQAPPGIPYALFVFVGALPWQFFSSALSEASNSLITNTNLISKVYFPRMIIPLSAIVTSLVDFVITFVLLLGFMIYYGVAPGWAMLLMPLFLLMAILSSIGFGVFLSALNVKYRDVRYVIPFAVQIGAFVSPVGFGSANIPEKWRLIYSLNPVVGIIDGFRWSILGQPIYWPGFLVSLGVVLFFLAIGIYYFRKMERNFADSI